VIAVRVKNLAPRSVWEKRYRQINEFERHLAENGTVILKFFLHISRDEQRKQLLERLTDPTKNWKFNAGDLDDRGRWDDYTRQPGISELVQPVMKPVFNTKALGEIILGMSAALGQTGGAPATDWLTYLRAAWAGRAGSPAARKNAAAASIALGSIATALSRWCACFSISSSSLMGHFRIARVGHSPSPWKS
jgi:hypothetical protein